MAYNEETDVYLQSLISAWDTEQKKMFGGTCYLLNGNMLCGVNKSLFILRLDKDAGDEILQHPAAAHFDMTGRPMAGWLQIDPDKADEDTLKDWIGKAHAYVTAMPPKDKTKKKKMK